MLFYLTKVVLTKIQKLLLGRPQKLNSNLSSNLFRLLKLHRKGRSVKENIKNGQGDWFIFLHTDKRFLINNQLRLVLTNEFSLNPYAGLKIKQHDLIDPASKRELRQRIRAVVSNLN